MTEIFEALCSTQMKHSCFQSLDISFRIDKGYSYYVEVIVVPASVVSSLIVVVGIVLSVTGADVELVVGGL